MSTDTHCWAETHHPETGRTLFCTEDVPHVEGMHVAHRLGGKVLHRWPVADTELTPTDSLRCSCARNLDGTTTTLVCPVHADTDPCLTVARVTGRRRKGTIRRGTCTTCGHTTTT